MMPIPERITGISRRWLESPSPPRKDPPRVARTCTECETWVFGAGKVEAADRLADHRRVCHS